MVSLPADIYATILDQLNGDYSTLKSCTIVSHSWLRRARFHLFRDLVVQARAGDQVEGCHFASFLQFLMTAPAVRPFIRHLHLEEYPRDIRYTSKALVSPYVLADILALLPYVTSVGFCGVNFTGAQSASPAELTFPMERVQLADIRCTPHMDPAQDWARILAVTPKIDVLEIHSELLRDTGSRSILPSSFLSASQLKLRGIIRLGDILGFLATVLRTGCLTSMEAKVLMPEHLSTLNRFLSAGAACELQHLHLDFSRFRHAYFQHRDPGHNLPFAWPRFHFGSIAPLSSLSFQIDSRDPSQVLSHVPEILSTCGCSLAHFTLIFVGGLMYVPSQEELLSEPSGVQLPADQEALSRIDSVIAQWPGIEEVIVDFSQLGAVFRVDEDEKIAVGRVRIGVERCMPKLSRREAVHVRPPKFAPRRSR